MSTATLPRLTLHSISDVHTQAKKWLHPDTLYEDVVTQTLVAWYMQEFDQDPTSLQMWFREKFEVQEDDSNGAVEASAAVLERITKEIRKALETAMIANTSRLTNIDRSMSSIEEQLLVDLGFSQEEAWQQVEGEKPTLNTATEEVETVHKEEKAQQETPTVREREEQVRAKQQVHVHVHAPARMRPLSQWTLVETVRHVLLL